MALSSNTVFEVRTTGDDGNGGGFVSGASGSDFSQQNAAELSLSDLACTAGTTTLTSSTGGFTSAMVGNLIQITGGTNFVAGWYEITGHTDTNTVTIDRDPTNGTDASSGSGNVGGALASPGQGAQALVGGNKLWVQSGTYTITTSTPGSEGPAHLPTDVNNLTVEGYGSTRGDLGSKPVLSAGSIGSVTLWKCDNSNFGNYQGLLNLKADANGQSGVTGFDIQVVWVDFCWYCVAVGCDLGFKGGQRKCFLECIADGGVVGFENVSATRCWAKGCSSHGFQRTGSTSGPSAWACIASNCGGDGIQLPRWGVAYQFIAYGNAGDGINTQDIDQHIEACIATNNGGYGVNAGSDAKLKDVAVYNNTSGGVNGPPLLNDNLKTLTADPFVDAANGDFNINDTAGGGAALRAESFALNGSTDVYPFRDFVSDSFGGGSGTARRTRMVTIS